MGKAYSEDLRLRVLEAIDDGMSKMTAHRTFRVSRSTIDDWQKLRAQTGTVAPQARKEPEQPRALAGAIFGEFAQRHQGQTLEQMALAWEQEQGRKLSVMSFSRALGCLGWTRKKRVGATKNATNNSAPPSSPS